MDRDRLLGTLGAALAAAAVAGGLALQGVGLGLALVGGLLVAMLATVAGRRRQRRPDPGADDPGAVAAIDALRRRGWRVVHGVAAPGGRVRHAILGPGGLIAAATCAGGAGRVVAPGRKLAAAEADRIRLEALTGLPATAMVVAGRGLPAPGARTGGVEVVSAVALGPGLEARAEALTGEEVREAFRVLVEAAAGGATPGPTRPPGRSRSAPRR